MIHHARKTEPVVPTAATLLDDSWTDQALAALAPDQRDADVDTLTRLGGVPRTLWEAALLGPARDMLARPGKGFRGVLVKAGWRLGGGRGDCPTALPAAVEIIHAGSLIVDDIEDDSSRRRGAACLHRLYGVPVALNTGNWMYFWPLHLVGRLGLPATTVAVLRDRMNDAMLRCHFGQALDLWARIGRVPQQHLRAVVAETTALKTGSLMDLAASVGAVAASAGDERLRALAQFGRRLGTGLQMLDDLSNLAPRAGDGDDKRHEDLRLGRATWPWAWAAEALDRPAFAALEAEARVLAARTQAGHTVDAEPLAAALRACTAAHGRSQVRHHLQRTLSDLRAAVGPCADVDDMAAEVARLERAYG